MIFRDDAQSVIRRVKKYLPENPIIIEAGGCFGRETVLFASHWPKGKIFTFEPVPTLFSQLQENTKNYKNIFSFPLALSDKNEKTLMYLSETYHNPGVTSFSSSLLQPLEHLYYDDTIHFVDQIYVQNTTFDDWAKKESIEGPCCINQFLSE